MYSYSCSITSKAKRRLSFLWLTVSNRANSMPEYGEPSPPYRYGKLGAGHIFFLRDNNWYQQKIKIMLSGCFHMPQPVQIYWNEYHLSMPGQHIDWIWLFLKSVGQFPSYDSPSIYRQFTCFVDTILLRNDQNGIYAWNTMIQQ